MLDVCLLYFKVSIAIRCLNCSFAFAGNLKLTVSHLLITIPLGTSEKAKHVNIGSQKHIPNLLNAEKCHIQPVIPNHTRFRHVLKEQHHPGPWDFFCINLTNIIPIIKLLIVSIWSSSLNVASCYSMLEHCTHFQQMPGLFNRILYACMDSFSWQRMCKFILLFAQICFSAEVLQ